MDTKDADYQKKINGHLRNGKKVIAYLSMRHSSGRQKRINYLFDKRVKRIAIIDEADFGTHRSNQARPLIKARKKDDIVLLMTGTNADRAVSEWPIDYYTGTTYPELVINKRQGQAYETTLKYFKHGPERDALVVEVEYYQMNLLEVANAVNTEWFDENEFPSWSKFAADPIQADGFFAYMLECMLLGKHNHNSVKMRKQTRDVGQTIGMMFLPGSMTNQALKVASIIAKQAVAGFDIVPLFGLKEKGKKKITNRTAESVARDAIEKADRTGQSVLFLSTGMAQRSFSVPRITDLFLAYDGGDSGPTIQKMSRALTPGIDGKVGRIWSLSFDPNRDDKFDVVLLKTAENYQKTRNIGSLKDALREVLDTIDIFDCTNSGAINIDIDTYLEQAHARNSLSRTIGKCINLSILSPEDLQALAAGNREYFKAARVEAAKKGKTRNKVPQKKKQGAAKSATNSQMKKARETVVTVVENMDIIIYGVNAHSVDSAFENLRNLPDRRRLEMLSDIEAEFGISFDLIAYLFESGAINEGFIELLFDA